MSDPIKLKYLKNDNPLFVVLAAILGSLIICIATALMDMKFSFMYLRVLILPLLTLAIVYRLNANRPYYLPSFYLIVMFIAVPFFAVPGYEAYIKLYRVYKGTQLHLPEAIDLWVQGTFFVSLGVYLGNNAVRLMSSCKGNINKNYYTWNWAQYKVALVILFLMSSFFTLLVIGQLGYVPMFKGNIEKERFEYLWRAGEWSYKLSRLWILVYFFSFIKLLYDYKSQGFGSLQTNRSIIIMAVFSVIGSAMYGDRFHLFIILFFTLITINKEYKRIPAIPFVIIFLAGLVVSNLIVMLRGADTLVGRLDFLERLTLNTFSEWREFAYVTQHYPEHAYLHGKTILSYIAPLLPKFVWAAFGVDKFELLSNSSAAEMSRLFGHYAGIRIGLFGEGFINYGQLGIFVTAFSLGATFGALERWYLRLKPFDYKGILIAFPLGMFIFSPIAQMDAISIMLIFYSYFIVAVMFSCRKEVNVL
jgi:hypothetical protein